MSDRALKFENNSILKQKCSLILKWPILAVSAYGKIWIFQISSKKVLQHQLQKVNKCKFLKGDRAGVRRPTRQWSRGRGQRLWGQCLSRKLEGRHPVRRHQVICQK